MPLLVILVLLAALPAPARAQSERPTPGRPAPVGVADDPTPMRGDAPEAPLFERRDLLGDALLSAWGTSQVPLAERVRRTQTAAAERGLRDVEGAALAVLRDTQAGSELDRAKAAVALAPGLPAAHFGLASAWWRSGSPTRALGAAVEGAWRLPEHLLARLWAELALWTLAVRAGLIAGLGFLAAACLSSLWPAAAALPGPRASWPQASRLALVAAVVLLPAALGEGVLGLVLGGVCVAMIPPGVGRRVAVLLAAAMVWLAVFPGLDHRGLATASLAADPVGRIAWRMGHGLVDRGDIERLAAAADEDPEAAHALAVRARREGRLSEAAERFEALLAGGDARVRNDAANVILGLGRSREAIDLYETATQDSLAILPRVNLSQAYGTIVKLEQQDLALAEAQSIDADGSADLNNVLSATASGTTFDLPLASRDALARIRSEPTLTQGAVIAERLRAPLAPGRLGGSATNAAAALALASAVGITLAVLGDSGRERRRRRKDRPWLERIAGALDLTARVLVPGIAGLRGARPLLGLLAVALAAVGVAALGLSSLPVPDPLALGAGIGWIGSGAAAAAGLGYGVTTLASLMLGERA